MVMESGVDEKLVSNFEFWGRILEMTIRNEANDKSRIPKASFFE